MVLSTHPRKDGLTGADHFCEDLKGHLQKTYHQNSWARVVHRTPLIFPKHASSCPHHEEQSVATCKPGASWAIKVDEAIVRENLTLNNCE